MMEFWFAGFFTFQVAKGSVTNMIHVYARGDLQLLGLHTLSPSFSIIMISERDTHSFSKL